ncbi:MAG: ADOP family duplicated permease, partial [Gemmatimonadaceae bacterium]
ARFVSDNFFAVLQVRPRLGRSFGAAPGTAPTADPVVVISDTYWKRDFAASPSIVGHRLLINGVILTVVGVTAPGFSGDIVGSSTDLWIPILMQPQLAPYRKWLDDRSVSWLLMMGRLAPGVTVAAAKSEIAALETHSILDHATANDRKIVESTLADSPIRVEPGARGFSRYRSSFARPLIVLMAGVILVMLVVCANVANLMLARSAARAREISVRMALGAGRRRLVLQLLTECLVLATAAGALALGVAMWGIRILLRIASNGPTPIPLAVRLDVRMVGYTAAVSLLMMTIFGVAPALRATRLDLSSALRGQGRALNALGGGSRRFGLGKWLVASQVALSMVLLVGAGLLMHSAQQMATVDLGMDRDHVAMVSVGAQKSGYSGERLAALMRDLAARIAQLPGVAGVGYSKNGIFSGSEGGTGIRVSGYEIRADSEKVVAFDAIGPRYVSAIGAHLLRGREFNDGDRAGSARVALLNETAARFYFQNNDPVGRTLTRSDSTYTIVGVVRDIEEQSVRAKPLRRVYFSIFQLPTPVADFELEVRATGSPSSLAKPLRDAVLAADRTLAPTVQTVNSLIRESASQDWLVTQIITFFGMLTLVLSALGLYGVMAYATQRRVGEFGIRMALGAEPGRVTRMILGEAMALTAVGVVVGLPAGLAAARLIRGQLFGVGLVDLPSMAGAVVILVAAAAVASYLPARRASRVAPLEALRADG